MISIHMTTHRRLNSGLLAKAVESVLSQDFSDFEFIICDDASVDGTATYLTEIAATDHRVRLFRNQQNVNSVAVSLGRCLRRSDIKRPWVSWMFDDCVLLPGALSRLMAVTAINPSARMVYGVTEVLQHDGGVLRVGSARLDEVRTGIATSSVLVPNGGILVHREVFVEHGWYDTSIVLRRSCDWDLFRRIIEAGTETVVLPETLMQEYGDLQPDSLRNAFTTKFDLMRRFTIARDTSGARLDLESILLRPVDWIPPSVWSTEDLDMMRYQFVEYFLSVSDVARAFRWASILSRRLGNRGILLREGLLRRANEPLPPDQRALAAGAFTGVILGAWREQQGIT